MAAAPLTVSRQPADGMGEEELRRLASNLKRLREAQDLTQQELADKIGIDQKQISRIERKQTSPSLATVSRVARALGVDVTDLLAPEV